MFRGPVQEMPVFQSRVELDPAVKDDWGIPTLRLSGRPHPHDQEVARFIAARADEILKEAGAIRTWSNLPGVWRSQRRPAPGGHLPHGRRSKEFRYEPLRSGT